MTSNPAKTCAPRTVVFVTCPGIKLLDLVGPMQVFSDTRYVCAAEYRVIVASQAGGEIISDTGLPVVSMPLGGLDIPDIDTVIVVGGTGAFAASNDTQFLNSIRDLSARSRRIGSVCTGAFILARAGVLRGRRATTHWEYCDQFREAFSDITLDPDAIYTRDGPVWTSAGVTAGIDMALAMVADDIGRAAALALAHSLVCYSVRPGGQSQFSTLLKRQTDSRSGRFDMLDAWIADNLAADLSVDALAQRCAMSPRNFARLYKSHSGSSPAKSVEAARLGAACRLLEDTDLPLSRIAQTCGFIDTERLRRAMMRAYCVAPGEYRQRFNRK